MDGGHGDDDHGEEDDHDQVEGDHGEEEDPDNNQVDQHLNQPVTGGAHSSFCLPRSRTTAVAGKRRC